MNHLDIFAVLLLQQAGVDNGLIFNRRQMVQQLRKFLFNQVDYNRAVTGNNLSVSILQPVGVRIQEWLCVHGYFLDGIKADEF